MKNKTIPNFFRFLLLSILVVLIQNVNAQDTIISFPDANFKNKLLQANTDNYIAFDSLLNTIKIDLNGDREIQQSEAEIVFSLSVGASDINSLVGINSFVNLQQLSCSFNKLTELEIRDLPNLRNLECNDNNLVIITLLDLPNFQQLHCPYNYLGYLGLSNVPNLQKLSCFANNLTTLDLSNVPNLLFLKCSYNQLTTLDLSNAPNLGYLDCSNNQLTSLDLSNVPNLQQLLCSNNKLTTLDLSNVPNLEAFSCTNNKLTTLDLSNVPNLEAFSCTNNKLTTLDLSNVVKLYHFACSNNQLTTLNLGSSLENFNLFFVDSNPLQTLYLKNGVANSMPAPNYLRIPTKYLEYICTDKEEVDDWYHYLDSIDPFFITVVDSLCTFPLTTSAISRIYPKQGGNIGAITLEIFGYNLLPNTTIVLKKNGSPDIVGDTSILINSNRLSTTLDLRGKALGKYDVVVTIPGIPAFTITNGFEVVNGIAPEMWVNIAGRTTIRTGRENTYTVTYGNKGNVDAVMIPLTIYNIPKDAIITLLFDSIKISDYTNDTNYTYIDTLSSMVFDSTNNTYYLPLFIPYVRASSTGTFDFKIKIPSTQTFEIGTKIFSPLLESTALLSSRVDGDCIKPKECHAQAVSASTEKVADYVLGTIRNEISECASNAYNTFSDISSGMARVVKEANIKNALLLAVNTVVGTVKTTISCSKLIPSVSFPPLAVAKTLETTLDIINHANDFYEIGKDWKDCIVKSGDCKAPLEPEKENKISVFVGNSYDPNEKVGVGSSVKPYLNESQPLLYKILFENSPTASLAAQTVIIIDTLDKDKLNLATFKFTSFSVANQNYDLEGKDKSFVYIADLRPRINLKLRVLGALDTLNGIVRWEFQSIDPATNQITEDPIAGFLPPNITAPQGDGSISFIVEPIENIQDGDSIINKAYIYFDENPVIITNEWKNIYDFTPPISSAKSLPTNSATTFSVNWAGIDNPSGIQYYTVYISKDDSAYVPWIVRTTDTVAIFTGELNKSYKFYVIAIDYVGNIEPSKTVFEAVTYTSISTNINQNQLMTDVNVYVNFGTISNKSPTIP
jgi:Leucine-rich repeat (LRR) protein